MASSDDENSVTEEPKADDQPLQTEPASASTADASVGTKKKSGSKKWGTLDITSEAAFKPSPSQNSLTTASMLDAKEKLKSVMGKMGQIWQIAGGGK